MWGGRVVVGSTGLKKVVVAGENLLFGLTVSIYGNYLVITLFSLW